MLLILANFIMVKTAGTSDNQGELKTIKEEDMSSNASHSPTDTPSTSTPSSTGVPGKRKRPDHLNLQLKIPTLQDIKTHNYESPMDREVKLNLTPDESKRGVEKRRRPKLDHLTLRTTTELGIISGAQEEEKIERVGTPHPSKEYISIFDAEDFMAVDQVQIAIDETEPPEIKNQGKFTPTEKFQITGMPQIEESAAKKEQERKQEIIKKERPASEEKSSKAQTLEIDQEDISKVGIVSKSDKPNLLPCWVALSSFLALVVIVLIVLLISVVRKK